MVSRARWTVLAIATGVVLSCASQASAWGDDGHRIVCRIAFRLLDQKRQEKIVELTKAYRRPNNGSGFSSFEEGCIFADEARWKARDNLSGWNKFDPFDKWHYLNVPRTTHLVADSHCNKNCVLTGITQHIDGLKAADVLDRAEALFFLAHWVGDIHQPLHVSYSEDSGGGGITVTGGFYAPAHMHNVWDTQIIRKAVGNDGWGPYADRLARALTPAEHDSWIVGTPLVWAQESYNIATRPSGRYCEWRLVSGEQACAFLGKTRTLTEPYQVESSDDVAQRLQQAGARLAEVLRRNLVLSP